MRRWLILVGMLLGSAIAAMGQGSATSASGVLYVSVGPSGACTAGSVIEQLTTGSGAVYACQSISAGVGTWTTLSSGSATGTVTGVTINGTTNQISITTCAITVSGTCTLSLPSAITLPGSLSLPGQLTSTETTGTAPFVVASTTVVANLNVSSLLGATWVSPGAIGSTTASSGAFTTLSASSTVSGTGFSTYLASPPAIGGTVAAAGTFSALTDTAMTGGPFCVHETSGVLAATSSDCGSGTGTFAGLNTTGANGTNTNANPISIAPATALGGSTAYFSVLGVTADTDTAPVVNFDTATGSQQNSFRAGIDGTSQLQVCWQSGPQGEVVFGSNVACSGIYTTTYAKTVFQSGTGAHTLMRMWQASSSQTGPFVQQNTATAAGTGFDFLEGWTGVTGTDTYHTGGTKTYAIQGDGSYLMNGCSAGSYLKADGTGCSVPSGSGTVNSGTATQLAYYASTGAAVSGDTALTDNGTTAAYTGSGGFTGNSFNSPSTTAPFLATSPVPSGACTPQATKSLMTVSSDGNFYVSNNGGTCYQLDTSNTVIPNTNGGTGISTSASTGVAQVASGTWSVSTALANGTTATTQSAADNTTKVATDAFVIANSITNPCSAAAIGSIIYQGSSAVACLAAPTGPTGVPNIISTIPGSAPSYGPAGITVNAQSTSSYSLGVTDRGSVIQTTNNTTATGLTVPSPTSTGYNQSYFFQWVNTGSVVGTATTTSSNVNGNATLKMVGAVSGHNPEASGWVNDGSQWWAWTSMPSDANGQLAAEAIANGSIVNAALAHAATTVQGQTCTLGSSCNINSVTTAHGVALNEGSATQLGGTAAGTSNTVLHGNTGADPTFSAVSLTADVTGVLPFANMAQMFVTNAQTSTYQVLAADFVGCKTIPVSSSTFTISLVASGSQPASGQCIWIINYGTGTPTIARSGQNINGAASNLTLAAGSASAPTGAYVVSDGTNYEAQIFGSGSGGGAVTSVSNSDGTITISPTTGSVVASLNLSHANTWAAVQTITNSDLALLGSSTGATTFTSANASATNYTLTIPAATGTVMLTSGTIPINQLSAATGTNSILNGNNEQAWDWSITSNAGIPGIAFTENSPSTGTGALIVDIGTAAGSTAIPLQVFDSLTGSQTLPALSIAPTWNTSGVVNAALLINVTNTASGAGSLLANFEIGGTSEWKVDKAGNSTQLGTLNALNANLGSSGTLGTIVLGNATSGLLTLQTATGAITSYTLDLPVAQPSGSNTFLSCTAASPAVCTWAAGGGGSPALSAVTASTASTTIANGNNPEIWNYAQTTNSQAGFTVGETTAATGTSDVGLQLTTLTTSTAIPLQITMGANGPAAANAPAIFSVVTPSAGGLASGTSAGFVGSGYVLPTGAGSAASTTGAGGAAGTFTIAEGTGGAGAGAASNGGLGGGWAQTLGTGGAGGTTTGVGGAGGSFALTGGAGGTTASSTGTAGAGSGFTMTTGTGGSATVSGGKDGSGGSVIWTLGAPGALTGTGTPGTTGTFEVTGNAPPSVSGQAGINTGTLFQVLGVAGGATTDATTAGGIGSLIALTAGNGGAGNTTGAGGAGGTILETTGNGGTPGTTGTGGAGGAMTLTTGTGAAGGSTSGNGGVGGALGLVAGAGGGVTGASNNGGAGGAVNLTAGAGANGGSGGTSGNGGSIVLTPGAGGSTGTAGTNGVVQIAGSTAGFYGFTQGTANTTTNTAIPANTIVLEAPTSVTAQFRVMAGAPASGFSQWSNSSGTMTETISATSGTLTSGVGTWGTSAVNTVLASTVANVAGHFTNLQVVTAVGGTCTTQPIFNVFDGTSNTGSTVTGSASTQTKGTGTSTAQTQTFAAGDIIGIYVSSAGGTCTTDQFTVTAQYSIP